MFKQNGEKKKKALLGWADPAPATLCGAVVVCPAVHRRAFVS